MPLVVAGTPIGNPDDASPRLRRALMSADIVAAEDTRRLRRLAAALDVEIGGRVVALYDSVERDRSAALLEELRAGRTVLLVTDAGMPVVSDPGHVLVTAVVAEGLPVTAIPGPSAVTTAVALSGLRVERFCFEGFLPRRSAERRARLRQIASDRRAVVVFEAPHRLAASLADMVEVLGPDRPAAVCRELTKTYEEVRRGTLAELHDWASTGEVRGEVSVVVEGAGEAEVDADQQRLAAAVAARVAGGESRRDAVDAVAATTGLSRRVVYAAAVSTRGPDDLSVRGAVAPACTD